MDSALVPKRNATSSVGSKLDPYQSVFPKLSQQPRHNLPNYLFKVDTECEKPKPKAPNQTPKNKEGTLQATWAVRGMF